ncbi:MAG TPA: hypothetical protein GXX59_06330 [Syntrophomonadaceae bacterium]|nr:hypothetical protein [Syntrophomonadaceae bacterium]
MNLFLSSLAKVCEKYLLQEKCLIVPGYQAGNVLCKNLIRSGVNWVNLRPETPTGLALRVAGEHLAKRQTSVLSGYLSLVVVEEILQRLQEEGNLRYFDRQNITQGLAASLSSAILELRMCGIRSNSLLDEHFICIEKGQDMKLLLQEYEDYLLEHSCLDYPGLLSWALTLIPDYLAEDSEDDQPIYLVPSFHQWKPLENELIRKLAREHLIFLPVETTAGEEDLPLNTDVELLSWLNLPDLAPPPIGDDSVSFFHAYGITNELRHVLRLVQENKISLDQVSVACTKDEYIPALYSLSRVMGFGLTVFEGIPIALTGPGRVLQGITAWIASDFSISTLINLFTSGDVEEIPSETAINLLKSSGIGWGRERYVLLEKYARHHQESENVYRLSSLIQSLFDRIPLENKEGKVYFCDFCSGLAEILQILSNVKDELDKGALTTITFCLEQIAAFSSLELGLEEAVEKAADILESLRVGQSGPKPGKIHLTSYRNLIWSGRPYTFVVGLDADTFPGTFRQDPVLLDSERQKIHADLLLGANKLEEKHYLMATALASRKGHLVLSYPSYDVVENRDAYPASVLLQVYRLLQGDPDLDYSDLLNFLGHPVGYCNQEGESPLDEVEWWISRKLAGDLQDTAVVEECYEGVARGQISALARQEDVPTEYDGALTTYVDSVPWGGKILSCSQIEYLASCPFAYFLRYVLGVYPPDEVTFDPTRWLDPLERGSLLHSLFCSFMRKTAASGEVVDPVKHRDFLFEMAGELVEQYKEKIPPPSELVFQSEIEEIHECCDVFLTTESRRGTIPCYFEVPFGMGQEEVEKAGCGLADPVCLDLGQGRILAFRGRIDRIDQMAEGDYCVWDYKTGSAAGYGEQLFFNKGQQVQHALYAIAAEEILRQIFPDKSAKVRFAGYIFPSRKGEGREVSRPAENRELLVSLLNTACEVVESGTFVASPEGSRCRYCEYAAVCTPESAVPRAKYLVGNLAAVRLDPWRRLQEYV